MNKMRFQIMVWLFRRVNWVFNGTLTNSKDGNKVYIVPKSTDGWSARVYYKKDGEVYKIPQTTDGAVLCFGY